MCLPHHRRHIACRGSISTAPAPPLPRAGALVDVGCVLYASCVADGGELETTRTATAGIALAVMAAVAAVSAASAAAEVTGRGC